VLISADREVSELMPYTSVDGFLGKPFEVRDLLNVIREHVD